LLIVATNKSTANFLQARCTSYCPTISVKALKGKFFLMITLVINLCDANLQRRYMIFVTVTDVLSSTSAAVVSLTATDSSPVNISPDVIVLPSKRHSSQVCYVLEISKVGCFYFLQSTVVISGSH